MHVRFNDKFVVLSILGCMIFGGSAAVRSRALPGEDVVGGGPAKGDADRREFQRDSQTNYNLILISLTNTRADHLGYAGYGRDTSPNLDRLARRSLVFKNAFAHASWTLPAVMSLFTSEYPFTHGLMNRQDAQPLPQEKVTLVDVLKGRGYVTAAFVGDRDYSPNFGHTSRFDVVFEPVQEGERRDWKSYGVLENTLPPAREWLHQNRDKKFFLLLQGYDTHCPFAVPKLNAKFDPDYRGNIDFTRCYWTFNPTRPVRIRTPAGEYEDAYLLKSRPTEGDEYEVMFSKEDIEHMVALYDGEIFNADALLGSFLDDISALGLEKNTIIVFYADHGDLFGKHGRFMRGGPLRGTFYDDVLRIPLVIYHPGLAPREVGGLVQVIDLAPTLLSFLGCPSPASFRGKSLEPMLALGGEARINDYAFAGSAFTPSADNPFFRHSSVIYSVRSLEWKLIHERVSYSVGAEDHYELYDLRNDPEELQNVSAQHPEVLRQLKTVLSQWLEDIKANRFKPH